MLHDQARTVEVGFVASPARDRHIGTIVSNAPMASSDLSSFALLAAYRAAQSRNAPAQF
jgi:hypothetical protein